VGTLFQSYLPVGIEPLLHFAPLLLFDYLAKEQDLSLYPIDMSYE